MNGLLVPRKYGPSRWASPKRYACAHPGCPGAAATLVRAGVHDVSADDSRTHNCCGGHPPEKKDRP